MDKPLSNDSSITPSSSSSSSSSTVTTSETLLRNVHKNSHRIAKPARKPLLTDPNPHPLNSGQPAPPQSQQPPVYNINKNDFRDVVQKLTGSPAHPRPAATHPRPSSSRLQKIRPPPLSQINNPHAQLVPRPQNDAGQRQLPPLPPLPSVHPAAESPISAYLRFLQNSASSNPVAPIGSRHETLIPQNELGQRPQLRPPPMESPVSAYMRFLQTSSAASPRGNGTPPPPQPSSAAIPPLFPALPLSPLPFGCIPSPKSPYGMISPNFVFPPQLPLSPTPPAPSPRWKGI